LSLDFFFRKDRSGKSTCWPAGYHRLAPMWGSREAGLFWENRTSKLIQDRVRSEEKNFEPAKYFIPGDLLLYDNCKQLHPQREQAVRRQQSLTWIEFPSWPEPHRPCFSHFTEVSSLSVRTSDFTLKT
jgi:hypothetical protein